MRSSVFFSGLLLAMAAARPALAAPPAAEANEFHREAVKAFDKHDYEAARTLWLHALSLDPAPKYLWNLAVAEEKSGHFVEALSHFRRFLARPETTDAERAKARKLVEEAEAKTGHVVVDAPAGASLSIDGSETTPSAERTVDVTPGKHAIEVRLGGSVASASVEASAGQTVRAELRFETPPPAPPAPTATPAVTPPPPEAASPDTASTGTWWSGPRYAGVAAAGLAAVAVGAGIAWHVGFSNNESDAAAIRSAIPAGSCAGVSASSSCGTLMDKINSGNQDATLSTVSFVVGGVAAAAAIGLIFVVGTPPTVHSGGVGCSPTVGLGTVGVAGHFE